MDKYDEDPNYFYLTNYYFTLGICRVAKIECEELQDKTLCLNEEEDRVVTRKDRHKSLESAHDRASELIANKILSLGAQKSRLRKKDPTEEGIADITFVGE